MLGGGRPRKQTFVQSLCCRGVAGGNPSQLDSGLERRGANQYIYIKARSILMRVVPSRKAEGERQREREYSKRRENKQGREAGKKAKSSS